jgi:hypothetical protein
MFRLAIVIPLILPLGLGPAFCCCNLRQLLLTNHTHSCCGQGSTRDSEGNNADVAEVSIAAVNGGRSACGCQRFHGGLNATLGGGASAEDFGLHLPTWLDALLSVTRSSFDDVPGPLQRDREMPSRISGREILRAYQVLRC